MSSPNFSAAETPEPAPIKDAGPIAIVGIGCRYADARGPDEFWEIVQSERDTVREAPQHRIELGYDVDHFYDPRPRIPGKISSKKAGFLEHPELFDPAPFGIAPRDALTMDPQQRLLVEVTWDALEDAGIVPESLVGERVAIMLGYMAEDYSKERTGVLGEEAVFRGHDVFTVGGMSHAVLSGRIAYLLGVTGPSFTLDTACSSSLIATHLACQSLRRGESKMAIAGGANLFLSPEGNIALSRSGMLSLSGACRAFDASADGFVRAEGAGVVVLRPLADALAEGNPIYAVIRGSGISTDGRDGGHMMAPGRKGQAQAMRDAYAQAGVLPSRIQYVETHGTGTMIGDPVEIGALADVMGPGRDPSRPLRVASVKGNLGHTESASGVAGLINAALAIRHRRLPRQLHFETPNPAIPWDEIPIRVQSESEPWPEGPALVGVNSFGISGTNAHVVLESPPERTSKPMTDWVRATRPMLVPITGHDSKSLHEMVEHHHASVAVATDITFGDLAYTLGQRRSHRAHRLTVVADSLAEMRRELGAYLDGNPFTKVRSGIAGRDPSSKLVMVFPGQGGQWLGMGKSLLEAEPVFASCIDRIEDVYRPHVDWSLRAMLDGSSKTDWTQRLDVLQPVLVAVEIALAELWASWGVRPDRVIGQSMGEIAAAYVAGCLGLEDMARLACHRGKIVARASGRGAMAVVSVSREAVEDALQAYAGRAGYAGRTGYAEIAGSNSPTTTIISGDRDAVTALVADFEASGVFTRLLDVDFASHCFHMDPLLDDFQAGIVGIDPRASEIPFDSTVDGCEKAGADLGTDYWVRNLRSPVAFDKGVSSSIEVGGHEFLEVSPHPVMSRAIEEIAKDLGTPTVYFSSLQRDQDEQRCLLVSAGELFTRGIDIDFAALVPEGRVVPTPLYAYQRKRFWFSERNRLHRPRPVHPLLGARSQSSVDPRLYSWDFILDADSGGYVADYHRDGRAGAPSGLYPEIALAVATAMWPDDPGTIERLEFTSPLFFGPDGRRFLQVTLRLEHEASGELRVSSREDESADWQLHAICELRSGDESSRPPSTPSLEPTKSQTLATDAVFTTLEACGVSLGARCRTLRELEVEEREDGGASSMLARLMLPRVSEAEWYAYFAHPAILENCFQLLGTMFDKPVAIRPLAVGRIALAGGLGSDCRCRLRRRVAGPIGPGVTNIVEADVDFFDRDGEWIGSIEKIQAQALPAKNDSEGARPSELCDMQWTSLDTHEAFELAEGRAKEVERWVVVSDSAHQAAAFGAELQKEGGISHFCEKVEDLPLLAERMRRDTSRPWGFLLLAWGRSPEDGEPEPSGHRDFRVASWAASIRDHCEEASQVWIATSGLQRVLPDDPGSVELAPLIAKEIETFATCVDMQRCRLFDASTSLEQSERVALASLIGVPSDERQYAARGDEILVPRLIEGVRVADLADEMLGLGQAEGRNFRAVHSEAEGLECIGLEEIAEPELAVDTVLVEVRSVALSQLDVMTGLGLARGPLTGPRSVALDFSGVVTGVGDATGAYRVGDEVIGVHPGALTRRIVVPTSSLALKPAFFDFNEAACLPFPYLAAQYSLHVVARLRAGERVLVLSASGGIGQAMISVARSLGAEVTATASTPERREVLRQVGARVLEDAARPDTADDFDVIVTSDSGALLHSTLARLAPGGRALDLCPRNDFVRPELGSIRLAANRSISSIDVGAMMRSEPTLVSALLEGTAKAATEGQVLPPAMTVFPLDQAGRALRYMAQNRHIGRVCIDLTAASSARIRMHSAPRRGVESAGPFVVSGSEPEAQAAIAGWFGDYGAARVVVVSSPDLTTALADLEGSRLAGWVHVTAGSTRGALETQRMLPALARADVDTRLLVSIRSAYAGDPTADRAWETRAWIDQLLLSQTPSDSYSAALSIGDDLTPDRIAERVGEMFDQFLNRRVDPLIGQRGQNASLVALSSRDRRQRLSNLAAPVFSMLGAPDDRHRDSSFDASEFFAMTPPERRVILERLVCETLADVLALSEEQREAIDLRSPINELGLDSLMSLELFLGLGRDLELEIESNWFETAPTLGEIAAVLVERLEEGTAEGSR